MRYAARLTLPVAAVSFWLVGVAVGAGQEPSPSRSTPSPVPNAVRPLPPRSIVPPAAEGVRSPAPPSVLPHPARRARASTEQIDQWIRQLDADEFLTREIAMLQLLEVGPGV